MKSHWPRRIALTYSGLIVLAAIAGLLGFFIPDEVCYSEFFPLYFFLSGPLVFILAYQTTSYFYLFVNTYFPLLNQPVTHFISCIWIIVVPGIFTIIYGSIQFYGFARLLVFLSAMEEKRFGKTLVPAGEKSERGHIGHERS